MMPRERAVFFHVALLILSAGLLVVGGLLLWLWDFLGEYEKSNPKEMVNHVLSACREGNYKQAMELGGILEDGFFDAGQYALFMQDQLGEGFEDVRIYESGLNESGERVMELRSSDPERSGRMVRFFLEEYQGNLRYGLPSYHLYQEPISTEDWSVVFPAEETLLVNGKRLSGKEKTSREPVAYFAGLDQSLVPSRQTVSFQGLVHQPELTLEGLEPSRYKIHWEGRKAMVSLFPDTAQSPALEKQASEITRLYARFAFRDASLGEFQKQLLPETPFAQAIRTYSSEWVYDHDRYEIQDFKLERLEQFSSIGLVAEVSFRYHTWAGRWERDYPVHYRIVLIRSGERWLAANIEVI